MNTRITQVCQRIGDALVTAFALAWFGLLGDHHFGVVGPVEVDMADRGGSDARSWR